MADSSLPQKHKDEVGAPLCRINRTLLPTKAFYFTFLAATGSLIPFIMVYMKLLGLTSEEAGVIYGVTPFLSFLVRPLVGALADRSQRHKAVLIVCTVLTAFFYFILLFVPPRDSVTATLLHVTPVSGHCRPEGSVLGACLGTQTTEQNDSVRDSFQDLEEIEKSSAKCSRLSWDQFITGVSGRANKDLDGGLKQMANLSEQGNRSFHHRNDKYAISNNTSWLSHGRQGACSVVCKFSPSSQRNLTADFSADLITVCSTNKSYSHNLCGPIVREFGEPLRFNMTNMSRLFNTFGHSSKDCDRQLPLLDLEVSRKTYATLTCPVAMAMSCEMTCEGYDVSAWCASEGMDTDMTFGLLLVIIFFASSAFAPVFSLTDAIIFKQLESKPHRYGQQRMWGTLGCAIFAITSTFVINSQGDVTSPDTYHVMFYLFLGLCIFSALVASSLRVPEGIKCQSFVKNACQLLVLPEVVAFLVVVMYLGMMGGTIEGFLFWYLADLGGEPILFGLCLVVNCAFEIPFFFFSGAIIKRVTPMKCLYLCILVLSLRLFTYSLLINPWYVLLAESLHGVTFGVMWAAVVNHAHIISPVGMAASVQGMVGGMNFGIGKGLGSLLTGLLFSALGERWTFRVLASACVVLLAVYVLLNTYVFTDRARQTQSQDDPNSTKDTTVQAGSLQAEGGDSRDEVSQTERFIV